MKQWIGTGLVLVTLIAAGSSNDALAFESGNQLAYACRDLEKGPDQGPHIWIPRTRDALLCWGYMQAMQDLTVLSDERGRRIIDSCPPEDTTTLDLLRSFLAYGRSHPDVLQGNTALAVITALHNAYPCRAQDANHGSE